MRTMARNRVTIMSAMVVRQSVATVRHPECEQGHAVQGCGARQNPPLGDGEIDPILMMVSIIIGDFIDIFISESESK